MKEKKKNLKKTKVEKTKKVKESGYFKKVFGELKLVKWPKLNEVLKYTLATIIFCALLCGLFMLLYLLLSVVKGWFI